jgi:hypothetical protein
LYSSGQIYWSSGKSAEVEGVPVDCPVNLPSPSDATYFKAQEKCQKK